MSLVLHKVLSDGTVEHEDFNRGSWCAALADPSVASRWGHRPDDCHDPAERHWRRLDDAGYQPEGEINLNVRFVDLGKTQEPAPPPPPGPWPPLDPPLTPKYLHDQTGLCMSDCQDILTPRKKDPPRDCRPMDKDGNFLLF